MDSEIRIKFLGIRALYAAPAKDNLVYGGNSSCTVIETDDDALIVNAGFGVNTYGEELIAQYQKSKKPLKCHFFLSDFLWDNVVGLPFFSPVHFKSSRIHVHTPLPASRASDWLSLVWGKEFSPFDGIASFRGRVFLEDPAKVSTVGPWKIQALLSEHPLAPYPQAIWKFTHTSGAVIVVSGNKFTTDIKRQEIISKIKGCDILVQSAIAPEISHPTMGGRYTFAEAAQFGRDADAKQIYLNGIHPQLTDSDLARAERRFIQETAANAKSTRGGNPCFIARELHTVVPLARAQPSTKKAGSF